VPHGPAGDSGLFGFQLIVVFNPGFGEKLSAPEQHLHLCAIGLVGAAVALVMGPAAYHRQVGPQEVTQKFIVVASRLLLCSMLPLMMGISLDFYLIARIILQRRLVALVLAALLLVIYIFVWFVLPRVARKS
jgi:hypothetical protein